MTQSSYSQPIPPSTPPSQNPVTPPRRSSRKKSPQTTPVTTPSKGKASSPRTLTKEALPKNGMRICRNPDKSQWPDNVSKLSSHLLGSFSGSISPGMKSKHSWVDTPAEAVDCNPCVRDQRVKYERVQCALEINNRCKDLMRRGNVQEHAWNRIWWDTFEKHALAERIENHETVTTPQNKLTQVCDARYKKELMVREGFMSVVEEPHKLTTPKPDATLVFTTCCDHQGVAGANSIKHKGCKCFTKKVLTKLGDDPKFRLLSSPFSKTEGVCFPWGIFEGKSSTNTKEPLPECQAVNAAVKCLKILEHLREVSALSKTDQDVEEPTPPIPCFTCRGQNWELWLCYRSGKDGKKSTYDLDRIFEGSMSNLWQCLQLLRIMERLREWALDTFKPWVDKYLDRIGGSEGTDRLGSLKPSPTAATFIKDRKTTEYSPEDPQLSPLKNKSVKPRNVASHMKGPMYFNILNALKRTFGKGKQNGKPTVAGSPTGEEVEREDKKKEDKRGEEKEEGEVVEDDEGESEDESEDESEEEGRENQLIKSGDFAEDEQWDHHHSPGILQAAGKEENRIQDNHQDNGAKYSEGNLPLDREPPLPRKDTRPRYGAISKDRGSLNLPDIYPRDDNHDELLSSNLEDEDNVSGSEVRLEGSDYNTHPFFNLEDEGNSGDGRNHLGNDEWDESPPFDDSGIYMEEDEPQEFPFSNDMLGEWERGMKSETATGFDQINCYQSSSRGPTSGKEEKYGCGRISANRRGERQKGTKSRNSVTSGFGLENSECGGRDTDHQSLLSATGVSELPSRKEKKKVKEKEREEKERKDTDTQGPRHQLLPQARIDHLGTYSASMDGNQGGGEGKKGREGGEGKEGKGTGTMRPKLQRQARVENSGKCSTSGGGDQAGEEGGEGEKEKEREANTWGPRLEPLPEEKKKDSPTTRLRRQTKVSYKGMGG